MDVDVVDDLVDHDARGVRRVLDRVARTSQQRCVGHPAHGRSQLARELRRVAGVADDVAARDVDLVLQQERHGHPGAGLVQRSVERVDPRDPRDLLGGQHEHLLAGTQHAAGDLARVPAVVGLVVADDPLDREARPLEVAVVGDLHRLEVAEQRRPRVPGHVLRPVDDVVAVLGADRDVHDLARPQAAGEVREVTHDRVEDLLVEVDEVHLVDRHHEVRDSEQRGDVRVALGLLEHALARVDEDHRQVGGRRSRDHVAGVLQMARRVGDDERPPRRREIAVRDVDRDALLTLGAQAVDEQRQVDDARAATPSRRLLDVLELVFHNRLGVEQQPPDQRRLAVVDGAGGGEAQ